MMHRGDLAVVTATGEVVRIISIHRWGTADHAEPWAYLMRNDGAQGVTFFARDLIELE